MVRLGTMFPFSSGHVHTVFPVLFRSKPNLAYRRQRVELADGDFVDVDWVGPGQNRVVVIVHGLEGHSRRTYVLAMARAALDRGFDVLAMNLRGCSGEPNRKLPAYHSGLTSDLHEVLQMVEGLGRYHSCFLIGFSLGGNLVLKYLGEAPHRVSDIVRGAVGISVPCDLEDSARCLAQSGSWIYNRYLLDQLKKKLIEKERLFSGCIDLAALQSVRSFLEFDNLFTAPWHGFASAQEYWRKASCKQFLTTIDRPVCIINAADDPFLGSQCFPVQEARINPCLQILVPAVGGHVGFVSTGQKQLYWSEWQTMQFLADLG